MGWSTLPQRIRTLLWIQYHIRIRLVIMTFKNNSYDMPPSTRDNGDCTYNSHSNSSLDNAAFDPDSEKKSISARGATTRDFEKEDLETERSDQTGTIPKGSFC